MNLNLEKNSVLDLCFGANGTVDIIKGDHLQGVLKHINEVNVTDLSVQARFEILKNADPYDLNFKVDTISPIIVSNDLETVQKSSSTVDQTFQYHCRYYSVPDGNLGIHACPLLNYEDDPDRNGPTPCGGILVESICDESSAAKQLQIGDLIISVNGINLTNLSVGDALRIISQLSNRTFLIVKHSEFQMRSTESFSAQCKALKSRYASHVTGEKLTKIQSFPLRNAFFDINDALPSSMTHDSVAVNISPYAIHTQHTDAWILMAKKIRQNFRNRFYDLSEY